MKLERTLIELETMVEYGCRYLLDVNSAYEDGIEHGRDMVADLSIWEFCDLNGLSNDDILDSMDVDDITDFCRTNIDADNVYDADEMLDCVNIGDIKECIKRNGWEDEFCNLDNIDPKDLFDYVTSNFALADWVTWREESLD